MSETITFGTIDPTLLARLREAAAHPMTAQEIDAQRASWVRGQAGNTEAGHD